MSGNKQPTKSKPEESGNSSAGAQTARAPQGQGGQLGGPGIRGPRESCAASNGFIKERGTVQSSGLCNSDPQRCSSLLTPHPHASPQPKPGGTCMGMRADGKPWVRVGGIAGPWRPLPEPTLWGCFLQMGVVTRGFRPGCPGYGRLADREGAPRGAEPAMGPGGLFPNPPPPAHPTARPDEPPTPAHGLSTATQPSSSLSRSISAPRSVLASSRCLRLC